jgi:hypothetical protein
MKCWHWASSFWCPLNASCWHLTSTTLASYTWVGRDSIGVGGKKIQRILIQHHQKVGTFQQARKSHTNTKFSDIFITSYHAKFHMPILGFKHDGHLSCWERQNTRLQYCKIFHLNLTVMYCNATNQQGIPMTWQYCVQDHYSLPLVWNN